MSNTALLIIDLQNDYFPGGRMELVGATNAGENARRLLERFRTAGDPVVHIRHEAVHQGATFFLPGTHGAEIHECVTPRSDETVVTKHFPNSFMQTPLEDRLREAGVTSLVVAGMMTQNCVDSTVRAGKELGFDITVVQDACATPNMELNRETVSAEQIQAAFMAALGFAFAQVVDTNTYLEK